MFRALGNDNPLDLHPQPNNMSFKVSLFLPGSELMGVAEDELIKALNVLGQWFQNYLDCSINSISVHQHY